VEEAALTLARFLVWWLMNGGMGWMRMVWHGAFPNHLVKVLPIYMLRSMMVRVASVEVDSVTFVISREIAASSVLAAMVFVISIT